MLHIKPTAPKLVESTPTDKNFHEAEITCVFPARATPTRTPSLDCAERIYVVLATMLHGSAGSGAE